jgi:hypothetical protein
VIAETAQNRSEFIFAGYFADEEEAVFAKLTHES